MPLENILKKSCHVKGCKGVPCFGFGSTRSHIRWACADHRDGLTPQPGSGALPSPQMPSIQMKKASPPKASDQQGSLL